MLVTALGRSILVSMAAALLAGPAYCGGTTADGRSGKSMMVLSAGGLWRKHYTFFPPRLSEKAAREEGVALEPEARAEFLAKRYESGLVTPPPPAGWHEVDFEDGNWPSERGVEFTQGDGRTYRNLRYSQPSEEAFVFMRGTDSWTPEVGLVSMRGRFLVEDRKKVKALRLSLSYRGGFVAYLNGKEVARGSMPAGKVSYDTPAEDYADDAMEPLHWYNQRGKEHYPKWEMRERRFGPEEIDTGLLKDGLNVMAIEFHRSDYPAKCKKKKVGLCFATVGLAKLELRAECPPANVVSGVQRPGGFRVWNVESWESAGVHDFGDPCEPLRPIKIVAARNGIFAGQVMVGSTEPLKDLRCRVSGLKQERGRGTIPATAISLRYGALNPTRNGTKDTLRSGLSDNRRFDLLLDKPPAEVPLAKAAVGKWEKALRSQLSLPVEPRTGAVLPVWLSVRVPGKASAGEYAGTLTVEAKGVKPVKAPIRLSVVDWTLPDVKDYTPPLFIYQSPESLATYYKVDMWSEEHWKLIEKSLEFMGEAGNAGLIFPLLAESCHGNPESMVVWEKKNGDYEYDFAIFDHYLDTALKYHDPDRLKVIGVNVWGGECKGRGWGQEAKSGQAYGAQVTVRDKDGKKSTIKLPEYGTPECEALWKPLLLEIRKRLKKKGLADKLTYGVGSDASPLLEQVAMFNRILPGTPWYREAHADSRAFRYDAADKSKAIPVRCTSIVWGGDIPDPRQKRHYGWRYNPQHIVLNFNRAGTRCLVLKGFPPSWNYRMWMESTLACGRNGNGRVGGDYFHLNVNLRERWKGARVSSEAGGGSSGTLFGSYPQSGVGQTGLGNSTTDLFGPGPDGPVTTVRFENAREGNQEAEARVCIEKALLAKSLPGTLAGECQSLLDERTNALRMWALNHGRVAFGSADWRGKNRRLFEYAAKVGKALQK